LKLLLAQKAKSCVVAISYKYVYKIFKLAFTKLVLTYPMEIKNKILSKPICLSIQVLTANL
jgi:hypothetical protein